MNLETWNVKIKVDTSQVSKASNTVKNSFNTMTTSTDGTAEAVKLLTNRIKVLTGIDIIKFVRQFDVFKKSVSDIAASFRDVGKNIKGIFSDNTFKLNAFKDSVEGALKETKMHPMSYAHAMARADYETVQLVKSTTRFERIMMSAKSATLNLGKALDNTLKTSLLAIKAILTSIIPILTTVVGLILQIKSAISVAATGDDIKDQSQKVYMTATAYQEWGYVLAQNGIELKSLKTMMRTFSNTVATNEAVLKKYGITANNVSDAFDQAVTIIQNLDSETEKIATATELFGNRAAELMPIFNMTNAETRQLLDTYRAIGGTMSNEMIAASDKLTDSITEMKAAWQGLKNALSVGIMPLLIKVVNWLTLLIAKITIVIKAILGIEETFGNVDTSSSALGDNLDSATESAKNLKKQLLGIDELNVFSSSDTNAEDAYDYDVTSSFEGMDVSFLEKIADFKEKVDGMKDDLQTAVPILMVIAGLMLAISSAPSLIGIIAGLTIAGIGATIGATNGTWSDMVQSIKETVAEIKGPGVMAIGILLALICGLMGNIPGMVIGLGLAAVGLGITAINNQWGDLKSGIITVCNDIVPYVMQGVGYALMLVAGLTANLPLLLVGAGLAGLGIAVASSGGWSNFVSNLKEIIGKLGEWFKEKILPIFTKQYWDNLLNNIKQSFSDKLAQVRDVISTRWTEFKNVVSSKMTEIKNAITSKWNEIKSWFTSTVAPVFTSAYWTNKWVNIKNGVTTNMTAIKTSLSSSWASIKTWFSTTIAPIFTTSYWTTKFTTMKTGVITGIRNVLNALIEKIETGINRIVNKINNSGVISGINKFTGWSLGFSTISIPRLANGGVLKAPTIAQLGEYSGARNNPEIAAPQSVILETLEMSNTSLISAFAQMTKQVIAAIEEQDMTVSIGDDVIAKSAARGNAAYKRMTGTALI